VASEERERERLRFKRIRRVILIRVLLLPFLVVCVVFGTVIYYFGTNLRSRVFSELALIAGDHRDMIEQFLEERVADLNLAAASFGVQALGENERLLEVLRNLQESSRAFFDLGVFDARGHHVAYVGPYDLQGKEYAESEWFRAVQDRGVYISDVFLGLRKLPHFVIAVRRTNGSTPSYLRATIDTQFFNDLVESIRVGKTGEAYLINASGLYQTRRRSGGALMEPDPDRHFYRSAATGIIPFVARDRSGARYVYATGRLGPTGWLLVVRQEAREAYAPLYRVRVIGIGIIFGGGGLVVLMAFLLASNQARELVLSEREKRQLGHQLILAGKFAELGEMSVGIAHEINNPLQVMKAEQALMADLLKEMKTDAGPAEKGIDMVLDSVCQIGVQIDRCRQITQGLLSFARKDDAVLKTIDRASFLPGVIRMVEQKARLENVRVLCEVDPGLPELCSDPTQLQQVLLNLLNNALYALRKRQNGEIRVSAVHEGARVKIAVADNGCGIDPRNLDKIFLPFFTTKPVGQGTGLGLSTLYGIVERLGGQTQVSSEPNVGTRFTVSFPIQPDVPDFPLQGSAGGGAGHESFETAARG
jgi:two-component system NtrC family sensor kinase